MTWRQFFFSPDGRFGRAQYWGASFAAWGVMLACFLPLWLFHDSDVPDAAAIGYLLAAAVVFVAAIVAHVLTIVKRFHDRDKPWPWCLIMFVPYIGGIWILVECGFLAGTEGANAFGPASLPSDGEVL